MRYVIGFFLVLTALLFSLMSCESAKNELVVGSPIGLWERMIADTDTSAYKGELRLYVNNTFDFIVLDTATNHSNSHGGYATSSDIIIFNDDDCSGNGDYRFSVDSARLTIVASSEPCYQRRKVLEGVWHLK